LLPVGVLCAVLAIASPFVVGLGVMMRWARGRRFRAVAARGRGDARRLGHEEQPPDDEGRVWFVGAMSAGGVERRMAWCRTLRWYQGGADVSHNKDIFRVVVERDGELPPELAERGEHDAVWRVRSGEEVSRYVPRALHPMGQVWVYEVIDHGQGVEEVLETVRGVVEG